jgi:hypothetical protein
LIADDSRWGQLLQGKDSLLMKLRYHNTNKNDITEMIIPVQDKPLIFTLPSSVLNSGDDMILEPFYRIHDSPVYNILENFNKREIKNRIHHFLIKL